MSPVSSNGRRPHLTPRLPRSRAVRLLIGAFGAAVLVLALVSPILIGDGTSRSSCAKTLRYEQHAYTARAMPSPRLVESIAIGVGVLAGCGAPPSNIDARSFAGVDPKVAIGIPSDASSVYVRNGVCTASAKPALRTCLRTHGD
jgi:hypothetical protein